MLAVVVILGIFLHTTAFPQNDQQPISSSFQAASDSLVRVVEIADKEVADIMIKMAKKTGDLYKELIPLLSHLNLNGKTVSVNNVDVTFNKEITQAQFQKFFDQLMKTLKSLENLQVADTIDFVDLAKKVQEGFLKAIATPFSYSDASWLETKNKILDAFKNANAIVRNSVVQLLDRYHNRLDLLADKLGELINLLPINTEVWINIRNKVHNIIDKLKNKITPAAISKIESAEKTAELDFTSAIVEINKDQPIVKRAISDIWAKVQSAVGKLGGAIKDATMKVIEQTKPQVMDALQNLKRIVIDAAKNIVIEVSGAIVKVIVGELTALSD
ncbi:uncharacterized protein LOC124819281 isoform X3 [Hydra vulgaris]|uniref:Uncharacterized protein LOC124819281 isoform X3 n=1 Tax=Hydra vulgaris TaxID=6087 RepID=A0ABM4DGK0_HYDVU